MTSPRVFRIAETQVLYPELHAALCEIGAPEWQAKADSSAELLTEFAGKSCYMSFSTELNQNLTAVGTKTNAEYVQNIIKQQHGCYDGETEVLTADGWKYFADVTPTDRFATRTVDGGLEYHPASAVIAAPYEGRMYRVESRGVDLLVTPNHNMLVCKTTTRQGRDKVDYTLIKAANLGHVSHAYVKTARWNAPGLSVPVAVFALLGFAIGDAHGRPNSLHFHLRKERKILYLQSLCSSLHWRLVANDSADKYTVTVPDAYRTLFKGIYDEVREKQIPPGVLLTSSREQLKHLLAGLMQADGHEGATGDSFDTTSQTLVGQVQQLCLHVGLAANVCYTYDKASGRRASSFGDRSLTRLSIIRRELKPEVNKFVGGVGKSSWIDHWEGMVYCVEVPNNTLYVRRNGIPVWCGNSVLEHSTVTFFITNVSRVVTHEIVRHRAGTAFSQTSGRYVRNAKIEMYIPACIEENPYLEGVFVEAADQMEKNLARLVEISGINEMKDFAKKKELTSAFRRILGNGIANHIVVTANHRAWRHMIEMRTAEGAEEEIRIVFQDIFRELRKHYPSLYADMSFKDCGGAVVSEYRKV